MFVPADTSLAFPASYSPEFVEPRWYEWWEEEGFFRPEQHVSTRNSVAMVTADGTGGRAGALRF